MKRIQIFSLILLPILALACGSASTPQVISTAVQNNEQPAQPVDTPIPPQNTIGKLGDTISQDGYIITLANIETATQYGDFIKAESGKKFIAVELIIESGANTGVSANLFYVSIKDASGYKYDAAMMGKEPLLSSQNDIPLGEKIRGWVTFEIPETATGLVLAYEPLSFGTNTRIRFDLGQ